MKSGRGKRKKQAANAGNRTPTSSLEGRNDNHFTTFADSQALRQASKTRGLSSQFPTLGCYKSATTGLGRIRRSPRADFASPFPALLFQTRSCHSCILAFKEVPSAPRVPFLHCAPCGSQSSILLHDHGDSKQAARADCRGKGRRGDPYPEIFVRALQLPSIIPLQPAPPLINHHCCSSAWDWVPVHLLCPNLHKTSPSSASSLPLASVCCLICQALLGRQGPLKGPPPS